VGTDDLDIGEHDADFMGRHAVCHHGDGQAYGIFGRHQRDELPPELVRQCLVDIGPQVTFEIGIHTGKGRGHYHLSRPWCNTKKTHAQPTEASF
jgi:hypothetical protein